MAQLAKLFGDMVRAHRTSLGLTQAQLADAAEVSEEWIRRIERGDASPSFDTIESLSKSLKVAPAELFGGKPVAPAATSRLINQLLAALSSRSADELRWIAQLITHVDRRPKR